MKTVRFFILAALAAFAASCSNSNRQAAADDSAATVMTVDSVLTVAPSLTDSLVTVEGVCTHTCAHGTTKMFIMGTDDSKTIRVEACELGAFPQEVINSPVTVTGYVRETRIDDNYLAAWEARLQESLEQGRGDGENTVVGCDSERAARGMDEATTAGQQIAEYRRRINEQIAQGRDPWLSFYHIEAVSYQINDLNKATD